MQAAELRARELTQQLRVAHQKFTDLEQAAQAKDQALQKLEADFEVERELQVSCCA